MLHSYELLRCSNNPKSGPLCIPSGTNRRIYDISLSAKDGKDWVAHDTCHVIVMPAAGKEEDKLRGRTVPLSATEQRELIEAPTAKYVVGRHSLRTEMD